MENIKREVYNQTSLVSHLVPDATIWDLDLNTVTTEDMPAVQAIIETALFSWTKGSKITLWMSDTVKGGTWADLLYRLNINVKVGAKAMKRIARAFSPRDVVVKLNADDINIVIVHGDEFVSDDSLFTDDEKATLLDGMISIRKGFVLNLLRRAGLSKSVLTGAEALSFTMVHPSGFYKALAYIVDDYLMFGADIMTADANVKSELWTSNDVAWVAFDVVKPNSVPKTNVQTDIMLKDMLGDSKTDAKYLQDVLAKDFRNVTSGTAAKSLSEWSMPSLENKLDSSNKVNADFAALADMAMDMMARGFDYRWSPGIMDMFAAAGSNQWYNLAGQWVKYPLPCAISVPVISESGACLIGEEITVNRGEIRAIRGGHVWVVNDQDYVEFFTINCGGGDLDDHFTLIFRRIEGVRKIIVGRIPMGHREFSVFNFVDGDPFPTYTSFNGVFKAFPEIPGTVPKNLYECMRDGEVTISGVGDLTPMTYPETYGPDVVTAIVNDLLSGEMGHVGAIINAVMAAEATKPSLLNNMVAEMETIIDSFTQGGGMEVRKFLTAYGESLLASLDVHGVEVDSVVTRRMGNKRLRRAKVVNGYFTQREATNKSLRSKFSDDIKNFAQEYNRMGNPMVTKILTAFGMQYADVKNTDNELFVKVRRQQRVFNGMVRETLDGNRQISDGGPVTISPEQWNYIYTYHLNKLREIANNDARKLELVTLINWVVCLTIRNEAGRISDRSIMNSVVWPFFVQALVNFGFAMNLNRAVNGANPWVTSYSVTCQVCGTSRTLNEVGNYIRFIANNRHCKNCI